MTPEELRSMMEYLRKEVRLGPKESKSPVVITFLAPTEEEMISAGLNAEGVKRLLKVPWWDELVTDIIETPEYCDPSDSPQQVLEYARDVISDYIRKRFPLDSELTST
jgi:hypothetical protein